jgi:FPC/CPF motif-containing protein YcgG
MLLPPTERETHLVRRFEAFVRDRGFPCVGAKSALSRGQLSVVVARDISSGWNDLEIYPELLNLVGTYRRRPKLFQSLVVLFEGPAHLSELDFERQMWNRIQSLSDKDEWQGYSYDARVSSDPNSPRFSLSFGGEAFFVVGLHPNATREARRFGYPAMVFNLHDQFERLRMEGTYEKLRATILDRERALSGSVNPMLSRFGEISEARQYSGRAVGEEWTCPFDPARNRNRREA